MDLTEHYWKNSCCMSHKTPLPAQIVEPIIIWPVCPVGQSLHWDSPHWSLYCPAGQGIQLQFLSFRTYPGSPGREWKTIAFIYTMMKLHTDFVCKLHFIEKGLEERSANTTKTLLNIEINNQPNRTPTCLSQKILECISFHTILILHLWLAFYSLIF